MTLPTERDPEPIHIGENELDWVPGRGEFYRREGVWIPKSRLSYVWVDIADIMYEEEKDGRP